MKPSSSIRFAGDVSIDKAQIITSKGFYQDISAQIITLQLYEDLFAPFLTGSLIIKESLDLVNLFPFIGEEFLELEITTPSLERGNVKSRFYIYKLSNRELIGDRAVVYQLHFISQEAIVDLNKKVSRVFSGKISDIVPTFVTGVTDGFESKKQLYVEPTVNNLKYISNYWSPVENLVYLTSNASANSPNYTFFENRDGFYFVSLDALYEAGVYQDFVYDRYTRDSGSNGTDVRNTPEDFKRIMEISIPVGYDYMDRIRSGMLSSKAISYDITRKKYNVKTYNMFQRFDKQKHLNPYPINSDKSIFRNNSMIINYPRTYGQFNGFGDTSNYSTIQERLSLMKLAQANRLDITVMGRIDYTVGQKVSVTLNKIEPISKEDTDVVDKMFSGYYLISAINHYIDRDKHECNMELIKESLQLDLNRN
jgi:hypothetical protein